MVKFPSFSRRSEPAPTQDENGDGRIDERDARSGTAGGLDARNERAPVAADASGDPAPAPRSSTVTLDRPAPAGDGQTSSTTEVERKAAERGALARAATNRPTVNSRPTAAASPTAGAEARDPGAASSARTGATGPNPTGTASPDRTDPTGTAGRTGTVTGTREATTTRESTTATASRPEGRRSPDLDRPTDSDRPVDRPDGEAPEAVAVTPAGPRPRASLLATLGLVLGVAGALFVLTGTLAGYGIGLGVLAVLVSVFGMAATRRRHIAGKTDALIGLLLGIGAVVVGILAMTGQFEWPTTDGDQVLRLREWLDSQFVDRF